MSRWMSVGMVLLAATAPARAQDMPLSQILIDGEGWRAVSGQLPAEANAPVKARNGTSFCGKDGAILMQRGGKERKVADGIAVAGMTLWPDGGTVVVGDLESKYLWAFRIEVDGSLTARERYYTLRPRPGETAAGTRGVTVDSVGRVYAATDLGIQVFDPTGRLCGVLLKPADAPLLGVAFGGPNRDTLYTVCGNQVYGRKLKTTGVAP